MNRKNFIFVSEFTYPSDFVPIWEKERVCSLDKDTGGVSKKEKLVVLKEDEKYY